jgi:hypothetical protein
MLTGKHMIPALTAAFMGVALASAATQEHPEYPACRDVAGTPVTYITTEQYDRDAVGQRHYVAYAAALYLNSNPPAQPVIVYNPDFVASLNSVGRAFVFSHECHHLASGDSRNAYLALNGAPEKMPRKQPMEDNADCAASRRVRDEFGVSREQLSLQYAMIRRVAPRDHQARMNAIMACYDAP